MYPIKFTNIFNLKDRNTDFEVDQCSISVCQHCYEMECTYEEQLYFLSVLAVYLLNKYSEFAYILYSKTNYIHLFLCKKVVVELREFVRRRRCYYNRYQL